MNDKTITIFDLLNVIKLRWIFILIFAIIGAVGAFFYSEYTYTPVYKSTTSFYINPNNDSGFSVSSEITNINYAEKILNTTIEILKTNDFLNEVANECGGKYSSAQLKSMLTFNIRDNTQVYDLSITSTSSSDAYYIAQKIENLAPLKVNDILNVNAVTVIDGCSEPTSPSNGSNTFKNSLLGAVAAAVVCYALFFLIYIFDVSIKTEDEVISTYKLPILGSIPDFQKVQRKKQRGTGK